MGHDRAEVEALVARILAIRRDRDMLYDNRNESLQDAEEALAQLRLGVRAAVPIEEGCFLGYGKIGQKWHLFFQTEANITVLTRVSTEWRVNGAQQLPELLRALVSQAEKRTKEIEAATALVDRFLDAFKEVPRD